MLTLVTADTKRDQVLKGVVAELTARVYMMDLQLSLRTAALTPPAVSLQHSLSQCFVFLQAQP